MTQNNSNLKPDFIKMLNTYTYSLMKRFNCHRLGVIKAFNPERMSVDVQMADKFVFHDQINDYAILSDLPLMVSGAGNAYLTFGDIVGSECLIHFNDTDIDHWFETGESYSPNTKRRHHFCDGIVTLRPHSQKNVFNYDIDGVVLCKGNVKIKLTDESIFISNSQADITMNGSSIIMNGNLTVNGTLKVSGQIESQADVKAGTISLQTHTHLTGAPGAPTGGPQ